MNEEKALFIDPKKGSQEKLVFVCFIHFSVRSRNFITSRLTHSATSFFLSFFLARCKPLFISSSHAFFFLSFFNSFLFCLCIYYVLCLMVLSMFCSIFDSNFHFSFGSLFVLCFVLLVLLFLIAFFLLFLSYSFSYLTFILSFLPLSALHLPNIAFLVKRTRLCTFYGEILNIFQQNASLSTDRAWPC